MSGSDNGNRMSGNSTAWDFNFSGSYTYDSLNRVSKWSGPLALCTRIACIVMRSISKTSDFETIPRPR